MDTIASVFYFVLGALAGLFIFAQIILPIIYALPRSVVGVIKGRLRARVIFLHLLTPVIWIIAINVLYLVSGWILPGVYNLITNQIFVDSWWFGAGWVIWSLFTKKGREDMRRDYESFILRYRKI